MKASTKLKTVVSTHMCDSAKIAMSWHVSWWWHFQEALPKLLWFNFNSAADRESSAVRPTESSSKVLCGRLPKTAERTGPKHPRKDGQRCRKNERWLPRKSTASSAPTLAVLTEAPDPGNAVFKTQLLFSSQDCSLVILVPARLQRALGCLRAPVTRAWPDTLNKHEMWLTRDDLLSLVHSESHG